MNNKIIVLSNGLLGSTVFHYLSYKYGADKVRQVMSKYPSDEFQREIEYFDKKGNVIINAAGAILQRTDKFGINYEIPHYLISVLKHARIIHPSSSCVFSGLKLSSYSKEDRMDSTTPYGLSKARGDALILEKNDPRFKIVRTSIIGDDVDKKSFLGWVTSQPLNATINGYIYEIFGGVTTLTWAKIADDMIHRWEAYDILTHVSCKYPLSKYDLINDIKKVYGRQDIKVLVDSRVKLDKSLVPDIVTDDIYDQLIEFRDFYKKLEKGFYE